MVVNLHAGQGGAGGPGGAQHEVVITNRETVTIRGVLHVESFDEQEVTLDTRLGTLILRGENLHIRQLDLDQGNFAVEGTVASLQYQAPNRDARDRGKGFLERLLR